jgi:hypothetical protein
LLLPTIAAIPLVAQPPYCTTGAQCDMLDDVHDVGMLDDGYVTGDEHG